MDRFISDQSSMASHPVVNYSSSSYGGFLSRSPNSPPPSPSLSPPPSIASLNRLFLGSRFNYVSRSPVYCSSPAGFFQMPQPPLLPLPRSATLPAQSKRIQAEIPVASVRSRRHNAKKGRVSTRSKKEASPSPTKVKEEQKPVIAAMEGEKVGPHRWPMKMTAMDESKMKLIEEEMQMESVYSLSPPPSSLPFPTFSLTRPKASSRGGAGGDAMAGYCIGGCVLRRHR